jgi:DNA-binding LacI/PurR family transcriptional regulator
MTVTKKDIADYLGISRTAVSLVLNNTPNSTISEKTRQRILQAVKELGYRDVDVPPKLCYIFYNRSAEDPRYFPELKSSEEAAGRVGQSQYSVVFMNIKRNPEDFQKVENFLKSSDVVGVLVTGELDDAFIDLIEGSGLPAVFYGSTARNDINKVSFDYRKAAYEATRYLITLGHRKIAFFSGSLNLLIHKQELEGYRQALQEAGLEFDKAMVQVNKEEDGYELCTRAEVLDIDFTAIYCVNTMIQFGALQRLKDAGVRVPGDVSLIGTWYTELVKMSVPKLTTLTNKPASREMPVIRLVDLIENGSTGKEQILIDDFELFQGETVSICRANS